MKRAVLTKARLAGAAMIFLLMSFNALAYGSELDGIKQAIKEKKAKWEAGETSVSALPLEKRHLRARLIKPTLKGDETFVSAEAPSTTVPLGLDWRNYNGKNFVTPVRNQGNCGSCWAFATTAGLESYVLIAENLAGLDENFSEQILVSCTTFGSCSGGMIDIASNYLRSTGLPLETSYPYTASDASCSPASSSWQLNTYKIDNWAYVTTDAPTVNALKNALNVYGPLVATMNVYADFFSYVSGVYSYTTGAFAGGHAVLIVGYDDIEQCFTVKNSWGTGWGEGGFFRIAYSQLNNQVQFGDFSIAYQLGGTCSYAISPTSQSFNDQGGSASINVAAGANCAWNSVSNAAWITIGKVTATQGNGTVYYSVAPNTTSTSRQSSISVAGQSITISQNAAASTTPTTKKTPPGSAKRK
jgi:C1A family cysteine protease